MIGALTSSNVLSSLIYAGTKPSTPFVTTTQADERIIVPQTDRIGSAQPRTNSWLITAGIDDLYIIPIPKNNSKDGTTPADLTGYPILYVEAGTSKDISGLDIVAFVVLGDAGQEYLVEYLTF